MKYLTVGRIAVLGLTLAYTGVASAATVINGSFENTLTPVTGGWEYQASIPGWNDPSDIPVEIRKTTAGTAYDGLNYLELDSTKNSWISQIIGTVAGQVYELTFAYAPREGKPLETNKLNVLWAGTNIGSLGASGVSVTGNSWLVYKVLVTGTGGNGDELKFMADGTSDSYGMSLDAVSISAVPLPGAALLFGTALLTGAAARRKKLKQHGALGAVAA